MDGKTHRRVGAFTGAVVAGAAAWNDPRGNFLLELIGGVIGGMHGARLPDVFEPADHPNHRQFAHSMTTLAGIGFAWQNTALIRERMRDEVDGLRRQALVHRSQGRSFSAMICELAALGILLGIGYSNGAAAGYVSHLALDAMTPKGIPFFGKIK